MGPIVTNLALSEYFSGREFFRYMLNTIGWIHFTLPGVFSDNIQPRVVNISMWTVPYELECYILLSILTLIGFLRARWISLVMFAASSLLVASWLIYEGTHPTPPGHVNGRVLVLCFLAGTVVYRLRDYIPYSPWLALAAGIFSFFALGYDYVIYLAPLPLAYAITYVGLLNIRRNFIVNSGDYSYGVYLYAAPIQQTVVWLFGPTYWLVNFAIALPVTVLFALFSWHKVEKPFLRVKRYITRKNTGAQA